LFIQYSESLSTETHRKEHARTRQNSDGNQVKKAGQGNMGSNADEIAGRHNLGTLLQED
jgi:hypothetical protein